MRHYNGRPFGNDMAETTKATGAVIGEHTHTCPMTGDVGCVGAYLELGRHRNPISLGVACPSLAVDGVT